MEQINNLINFFRNITSEQLLDWGIAAIVIIFFIILSPVITYFIIKMFKIKEKDKVKIKNSPFYLSIKALLICGGIYIGVLIINPKDEIMLICKRILDWKRRIR